MKELKKENVRSAWNFFPSILLSMFLPSFIAANFSFPFSFFFKHTVAKRNETYATEG
jgi:hypothetical protein